MSTNHSLFTYLADDAEDRGPFRWAAPLELPLAQTLSNQINTIRGQLVKTYPPVPGVGERDPKNARHQRAMEWAGRLSGAILALGSDVPELEVRYCARVHGGSTDQARVALHQEPIEVAERLNAALWEATPTVICTTATLTVQGSFGYFRRQVGAPQHGVLQRIIDSPFDFQSQALLYTPQGLIPVYGPGEDIYAEKLANEVERLVNASQGRAFVLCTSTRRAQQLFDELSGRLVYPCYCQGMAPRNQLLDLFQDETAGEGGEGPVLFATKSFWEGVDIPGEALSLVIIDKLPFQPHRDPVIQHRDQLIRDAGGNPFGQFMLPEAILALKQGVGRLIRTETDRGVMAILDSRINTKRYGAQMIASLPRARRTLRFEDVEAFFASDAAGLKST